MNFAQQVLSIRDTVDTVDVFCGVRIDRFKIFIGQLCCEAMFGQNGVAMRARQTGAAAQLLHCLTDTTVERRLRGMGRSSVSVF